MTLNTHLFAVHMGKTQLFATLWAGAGIAGVGTLALAAVIVAFVIRRRASPARYALLSCLTMLYLYLQFGTDMSTGFYLRSDGVQPSRGRCIANVVLYTLHAMTLVSAAHLNYDDGENVVLLGAAGSTMLGLADLAPNNLGWLPWAGGVMALLFQQALVGAKSGDDSWRAITAYVSGALTFTFAMPFCQALSWTMTGVIDSSKHNRENAEIFYLCVYTVGVVLWGMYASFTYERLPTEERRRQDWLERQKGE